MLKVLLKKTLGDIIIADKKKEDLIMKKLLTISILAVMLVLMTITGVNATTNDNLAETLYNMELTEGSRRLYSW